MGKTTNAVTVYPPSADPETFAVGKSGVARISLLMNWKTGIPGGCTVHFSDGQERTFPNMPFHYDVAGKRKSV